MTTDPLQAAPRPVYPPRPLPERLTEAEIEVLKLFANRVEFQRHGNMDGSVSCKSIDPERLWATIDHLKSSAERTGPEPQWQQITPPEGYVGWTCGRCGGPVAGRYSQCDNCKLDPIEEDRKRRVKVPSTAPLMPDDYSQYKLSPASPASVVSAPAPGEVEELRGLLYDRLENGDSTLAIARAILTAGYRKSLPTAEVVDEHGETDENYADIGRVFMEAYRDALDHPAMQGYICCDSPSEIISHLLNAWDEKPTPTAPLGTQVTDKTEAWDMREKGEGE